MAVQYLVSVKLEPEQLATLFENSGIRRPTQDMNRLRRMIENANLTVTAWDNERLIGVARALTDFSWCCYLSDLAVDRDYQRQGIGQELVRRVHTEAGEETSLVLVSAPDAMGYYPKIGLEQTNNGWMIKRAH